MSQQNDNGIRTFSQSGGIGQWLRVKDAGTVDSNNEPIVSLAGATDHSLGVATRDTFNNDPVAVALKTKAGTRKMVASKAISRGSFVYGAASGKITDAPGTDCEGIALESASANGDIIEVMFLGNDGLLASLLPAGTKLAVGVTTLSGTNPTDVNTGLGTVAGAVAVIQNASAPNDPCQVTVDFGGGVTAGHLDLYAWKATNSSTTTLIASTNSTVKIAWLAWGT